MSTVHALTAFGRLRITGNRALIQADKPADRSPAGVHLPSRGAMALPSAQGRVLALGPDWKGDPGLQGRRVAFKPFHNGHDLGKGLLLLGPDEVWLELDPPKNSS